MSRIIGFGEGQDFVIFVSTADAMMLTLHTTSAKIMQNCQSNPLFVPKKLRTVLSMSVAKGTLTTDTSALTLRFQNRPFH